MSLVKFHVHHLCLPISTSLRIYAVEGANSSHEQDNLAVNGPQLIVSLADSLPLQPEHPPATSDENRLPLEKEVSRALRRASGYSAFSIASISTIPQDRHDDLPSETSTYQAIRSLLGRNIDRPPSSFNATQNGIGQEGAQARAFYDKQSLPSDWVSTQQQTVVRVPINRPSLPDSPPDSPLENFETSFGRRQVSISCLNFYLIEPWIKSSSLEAWLLLYRI